jgi:thiosulfate reductase cytochrome b subunit
VSLLRTLRKLILGETWSLPLGLAAAVVLALVLRAADRAAWHHAGGFVLLGAVLVALVLSVAAGTPRRPGGAATRRRPAPYWPHRPSRRGPRRSS